MTFKEWLEVVKSEGLICDRYLPLVLSSRSRKQFMDVALDINGITFLCDMVNAGYGLPYNVMNTEFAAYMNGRYIHVSSSSSGAYSSSMYCGVKVPSEITASTTLLGIFNCHCEIHVPKNHTVQLCVDSSSDVTVKLEPGSRCYIDLWDGGIVNRQDNDGDIIIKRKKYNG